jgi:hypothetical protein
MSGFNQFVQTRWKSLNECAVNGTNPRPSRHSSVKKGIKLQIDKADFYNWCNAHKQKIVELLVTDQKPMLLRKNFNDHYNLDNLTIVSAAESYKLYKQLYSKK